MGHLVLPPRRKIRQVGRDWALVSEPDKDDLDHLFLYSLSRQPVARK
jgi:hypothetical protein